MVEKPTAMVVDDSAMYRRLVSTLIAEMGVRVGASAASGETALRLLNQTHFDIVFLDIEMPGIGGIETLTRIHRDHPEVHVVVLSGTTSTAANTTIRAMVAGAFDVIGKPSDADPEAGEAKLKEELQRVLAAIHRRFGIDFPAERGFRPAPRPIPAPVRIRPASGKYAAVVIGVSTGGPVALGTLLPELPADFPLPILVVQHMPAVFTEALAQNLDKHSRLEVREAKAGERVRPGRVYIAPGGRHMIVRASEAGVSIGVHDGPKENSCRPAVDVLFRSAAHCYRDRGTIAVVMTGMGADGLQGVRALKEYGCYCITQSESSCVVYGMPHAVDAEGLSDESIDLPNIAGRLVSISAAGSKGT